MKNIKIFLFLFLCIGFCVFILQNASAMVTIRYFHTEISNVNVFVLMFLSFVLGMIFMMLQYVLRRDKPEKNIKPEKNQKKKSGKAAVLNIR